MNDKQVFCLHDYQNTEAVMARPLRWRGLFVKETCIKCKKEKYFYTTENTKELIREFCKNKCFN